MDVFNVFEWKEGINVKKMHKNRISYDLTLGREGLERNINPSGSFPGVIMEKLKQNSKLIALSTSLLVFHAFIEFIFHLPLIRELKGTRLMEFPNKICK